MKTLTREELLELLTNPQHQVNFDDLSKGGVLDLIVTVPPSTDDPMGRPKDYYVSLQVDLTTAVRSDAT